MITQSHRYILLIVIIIYYCHHDFERHNLSWVLIYILEKFLPWMHACSTQFSISLSVWVFWPGQPNWPSQTRFPRQLLQKLAVLILALDMPRTNTAVSIFTKWSQLLSSRSYYYFLLTMVIIFIAGGHIFGISVNQWIWVVTNTILPCFRILLCS